MEHQTADHIKVGQWGEEIACRYLKNKGYIIVERNFRRKWGEIDIICKKDSDSFNIMINDPKATKTYPKSSTWNTLLRWLWLVPRETHNRPTTPGKQDNALKIVFVEVKTLKQGNLDPEENVTTAKQKKLIRTCELYMSHNNIDLDSDWQIDVIAVLVDKESGTAKIRHIENAVY